MFNFPDGDFRGGEPRWIADPVGPNGSGTITANGSPAILTVHASTADGSPAQTTVTAPSSQQSGKVTGAISSLFGSSFNWLGLIVVAGLIWFLFKHAKMAV